MGSKIDTIFVRPVLRSQKKPKKKKKLVWPFFVLGIILFSLALFIFAGKVMAQYVLDSIKPVTLFKNGKYLILFQNNAELRSSGGFIGSFAVVETNNYDIKKVDFNTNIMALDRTFEDNNYVEAPTVLKTFLKGKSWSLKDSNYDSSYPDAANDIINFYEKETSENIDGVIATNASLMVELLKLIGPIKLDKYNLTVTADNFYDVTQYQVEKGYFENPENQVINEPKTFLKDLYPLIMQKAFSKKVAFYNLVKKELTSEEVLMYFKDSQKEVIVKNENWAGEIKNTNSDYLYINGNSYSGDKSSIKVSDDISYDVSENEVGQLVANLKITKIHNGSFDWPDGANNTWTRIYTPMGSSFTKETINGRAIPKNEITIGDENNKTYFGYKIFTNPGDVSVLELEYILPISKNNYSLLIQKQPGTNANMDVNVFHKLLYSGKFEHELNLEYK